MVPKSVLEGREGLKLVTLLQRALRIALLGALVAPVSYTHLTLPTILLV